MAILLLADSGSTKTEWCLCQPGCPPISYHTDGLNPYFLTQEQLQQTIQTQLLPKLPALPASQPLSVFFYGAGCSGPEPNQRIEAAILGTLPATHSVSIASDMLGAARSVAGHSPGIVGILGTGSNVCYFNGDQIVSPAYSLGFWLGDEGSGGNLGKRLITAYLHGLLPDDIRSDFTERYSLDRLQVLDHAYNKPNPNRYFASFAPFLSQHQQHPFVQQLVVGAFTDFVQLYVRRMPNYDNTPIHVVGSVAYYFQSLLKAVLSEQGLIPGRIVQAPMPGLIDYHQANHGL
ncbi:N-acetylglucosamine kinase [Fibrella sp. WM1]|uniref:N-acetylglucosamine kinase n=1 Tax=Fibrella musci TaxID=3242485 RepID=UPI003521C189